MSQARTRTEDFISGIAPYAVLTDLLYSVPASVTIAQAILESNSGDSELAEQGKNFFGIKGEGRTFLTTEFLGGSAETVEDEFRTYRTKLGSFLDHAKLLSNERYGAVRNMEPKEAFAHLSRQGYATDPEYPRKLSAIYEGYDLDRFDRWAKAVRWTAFFIFIGLGGWILYYFYLKAQEA